MEAVARTRYVHAVNRGVRSIHMYVCIECMLCVPVDEVEFNHSILESSTLV